MMLAFRSSCVAAMQPSVIIKPVTAQELKKALDQPGWKLLSTIEVVNSRDVQGLTQEAAKLVRTGKKVCVVLIERS